MPWSDLEVLHSSTSDSLAAAYRNLGRQAKEDLTCNQGLCQHYQMQPTRNNRGRSHENGSIESPPTVTSNAGCNKHCC